MRNFLLVAGLAMAVTAIRAQPAPDFTLTDSHGQVHHLYDDYLDLGKTVVIEIFFTTCPPCNSLAPLLEPFYQEWGGGDFDVEFFELSDKNFDTDALVNAYQAQYGETMVGVGVQGGSNQAVIPYKNGTYGPWFGTPTFIVISPDGTVNYDVDGNSNQATINALDAAIAATGAEKPGGGGDPVVYAPDFVVTDVNQTDHVMYDDYLSQGKTVVLEIFNTTCPTCTSIANAFKTLYEDWGGGSGDVQFIALTDKPADSETAVFNYMIDHNLNFPCISAAGGSIQAAAPYKDGTFGDWQSNPTFVVVAPDGTVKYDVRGSNNAATIDSLEAAIMATGASMPAPLTLAPDFTITDSHGAVHHLYADYLNHGQSVLLEVFYTSCPPCNSIAPLIEPFYQEWGAGDYDVEFFELSDKNFDTDALVNNYQAQHGETTIAAGKDGGSVTAVQPYKNGSFGPWYGTPTFVVIAPDGTVNYDVDGPNNQATIAAIDAALLATGAQKPPPPVETVSVTGGVSFLAGTTGVNNVIVQVLDGQGNVVKQDTSDLAGHFNLDLILDDVQPDWQLKAIKTGNPINGVSTLDLVRIQKHLLGLQLFDDPYTKLASDVNNSGTISSLDIITIVRLLLGLAQDFPDGQSWIMIPADTDFGPPTQHPPVIPSYTIPVQDIINGTRLPNFTAIKKGDPSGSANPG